MLRLLSKMCVIGIAATALPAWSADLYAVAGAQYSRTGEPYDISGPGYHAGGGYVINAAWSVEVSAEQLFSDKASSQIGPRRVKSQGVTLSALGKTRLQEQSVLFYRAGISSISHEAEYPYVVSTQTLPNGSVSQVVSYNVVDDSLVHAILGLGIEQNFSANWFGRAEVVHTFKKQQLQADSFRLSLGYRF